MIEPDYDPCPRAISGNRYQYFLGPLREIEMLPAGVSYKARSAIHAKIPGLIARGLS